jgi:outer membrane murein-binding lipoprotein Lpp
VALIAGAVVSLEAETDPGGLREDRTREVARVEALDAAIDELEKEREAAEPEKKEDQDEDGESEDE